MRSLLGVMAILSIAGCSDKLRDRPDAGPGEIDASPDACDNLQCRIQTCPAGSPNTSISGTVFAPNGTLALYGFDVYVPNEDPGPIEQGLVCGHCTATLPGAPLVAVRSDEAGHFKLDNVPAGVNIPVVISSGKWRRQLLLPQVMPCQDNVLTAEQTRLPRDKSEGDMPQIAVATGGADAMECMVRRLGISDFEITTDHENGKVHLYKGEGGTPAFRANYVGGQGPIANATTLWNNMEQLKKYDIVMFSCEGSPYPEDKPQAAMDNVKMYADLGGRLFMSHYHGIWVKGAAHDAGGTAVPAVWPDIAVWEPSEQGGPSTDMVDELGPKDMKGVSFATWLVNVQASPTRDVIPLTSGSGRATVISVDPTKGEQWVTANGTGKTQMFQFEAPNEVDEDLRCGKVVYSDMHVSVDTLGGNFPDNCGSTTTLSAQEKALAFMFFDIASCVGPIQ